MPPSLPDVPAPVPLLLVGVAHEASRAWSCKPKLGPPRCGPLVGLPVCAFWLVLFTTMGVAHPASRATSFSGRAFVPQRSCVAPFQSRADAVGQDASATGLRLLSLFPAALFPFCAGVPAMGVGHPPEPLPDVRGADARSAQIGGPDCISQVFQVNTNSAEPRPAKRACNLLASDD
jgi:hypothetical protein